MKRVVICTLLVMAGAVACNRDRKTEEVRFVSGGETRAASQDLILAAQRQGAFLPPELADPKLADETTLPSRPLELPRADVSRAVTEREPNNTVDEATPMGPQMIASGQIIQGDYDHFTFETAGDPQLYVIEATGRGVGNLIYAPAGSERVEAQEVDSGRFVIANVFLSPGKHRVEVRGNSTGSDYSVRAVAMGKPDMRMEREPNDVEALAHPLTIGIPRTGLILNASDADLYRFSLRQQDHVMLRVTPPSDLAPYVYIAGGSLRAGISFRTDKKGEVMKFDGVLPPGDYLVHVKSNEGGSKTPYRIRLDRLDPFAVPVDAEPNNSVEEASPLPGDLVLRGTAGEFNDYDWYRIPTVSQPTKMRVQVLGLSGATEISRVMDAFQLNPSGGTSYVDWTSRDSVLETTLPPNVPVFVRMSGPATYQARLIFTPGISAAATSAKLPVTVSFPAGPHIVEAFSRNRQRLMMPVKLHNTGSETLQLKVDNHVSNISWGATRPAGLVSIPAGKDIVIPMQVLVPPDAGAGEAVQVAVRASSSRGQVSAATQVLALCGAAPVNAEEYRVLPPQLLGGLNVASTALGAKPVAEQSRVDRERLLYDGLTPNGNSWIAYRSSPEAPVNVTVALAGDRPVRIAGITLVPGPGDRDNQPADFDVLVSQDGESFQQVMSGRMNWPKIEQAFAFQSPVSARFARLRLRTNQTDPKGQGFELAEFKVIAVPGEHPFSSPGFNLSDSAAGGYVVYSHPLLPRGESVITEEADDAVVRLDPANANEFVIGFRHNRAAMISSIEMVQATGTNGRMLGSIDVSVSTESPAGPWTVVNTWKVDTRAGSTSSLQLPRPVWARFVRFSTNEAANATDWWHMPETIRIREAPADNRYRSILGEWGHYSRDAIYERVAQPRKTRAVNEVTGNGKKDDASEVKLATAYHGKAILGEKEDWYKIEIPKGQNRLAVSLDGDPMLRVAVELEDKSGKKFPVEVQRSRGRSIIVQAAVNEGETYYLRVYEPPRSIALVWDNSSSIAPYSATLYRALSRFVEVVQPKKEYVNLMPFQDVSPRFLLPEWSDQPFALQAAVQNYGRQDGSSNAELALLSATQQLQAREGNKAILFLTDAESDGYNRTSELWSALTDVQPQIFAVELHGSSEPRKQQHLMESWVDASGGHYSVFRTSEDIDKAFERASCFLRQPARYTLIATASYVEPPAPGALEVKLGSEAMSENAIEMIFDASGSMLQRMGSARRIDVAKSVLINLVEKTIPAGTPFAFRAFGTKKANCDTDLLLKPQPLDRSRVATMIRNMTAINNAKTPIGASLRAVAEDLKGVKGQKIVVLVTDGEETCDGDPAGSIKYLRDQGVDVRLNIVGFGVDQPELKATFDRWAEMGGGRFFDAKSGEDLSRALNEALRPKFQVLDPSGTVIVEGTAGGSAVTVPAGTYTVKVLTSPVRSFERVRIAPGATQRVEVK